MANVTIVGFPSFLCHISMVSIILHETGDILMLHETGDMLMFFSCLFCVHVVHLKAMISNSVCIYAYCK